ncbi:diacylglycerol/lipid kinase family protein, partial [Clostridium polynesiense]|uniref:diacylglycerol/lipid kinase family protein n=1 Tax=Clostridium polynesiense TaxID=1325933 RepID=UPI00164DB863
MKHLFIINPEAGKGKALGYIEIIHRVFENIKEPYFIEITKYPGHATEIVQKYSLKGEYRVYSIGGDGTLNEVLNGVVGTKSTLAIVPAGSGNDFIKNITSTKDEDLLYRTVTGEEKYIDLGR